jgi:hypothetical protein
MFFAGKAQLSHTIPIRRLRELFCRRVPWRAILFETINSVRRLVEQIERQPPGPSATSPENRGSARESGAPEHQRYRWTHDTQLRKPRVDHTCAAEPGRQQLPGAPIARPRFRQFFVRKARWDTRIRVVDV